VEAIPVEPCARATRAPSLWPTRSRILKQYGTPGAAIVISTCQVILSQLNILVWRPLALSTANIVGIQNGSPYALGNERWF